jgi:hypothetical protein
MQAGQGRDDHWPSKKNRENYMKRVMMVVLAATLLTASMPAFASAHSGSHDPADVDCARDCDLLLKDCAKDADTIQARISKLEAAIKKQGANQQTLADVKVLQKKLDDAKELLKDMEKGGR